MPRKPRRDIVEAGGYYHVIARGNNKMLLFCDGEDYRRYLEIMHAEKTRFRVFFLSYVVMPNHVHILLCPETDDLPRFMHRVQLAYARHFIKKYGFVGHVWQDRYKSLPIKDDAYLAACATYIEENPVRAGLVDTPSAWPYSSSYPVPGT